MSTHDHNAYFSEVMPPLSNIRVLLNKQNIPFGFLFQYQNQADAIELDCRSADASGERDFSISDSESIILIFVYARHRSRSEILGMQFVTNTGRVSPVFGESCGYIMYVYHGCSEDGIRPFVGFSRMLISKDDGNDALTMDGLKPEWSQKTFVESRYISTSGWSGNSTSERVFNLFSSISDPATARLSSVKIWSGDRIDAFQLIYSDGTRSVKEGGSGGTEDTFTLNAGEYISRIETRVNPGLEGLTFVTNQRIVVGVQAVWALSDPVSSTLIIEEIDQSSTAQKRPISVNSYEGSIVNNGEGTIKKTMQWKYTTTKSTTVTVNKWWSMKGSLKMTMKISVKGKAGIPLVAEGEVGAEMSSEMALEAAGGMSFTNGETMTSTSENVITEEVTVGPGTAVRGVATWAQYTAEDVIWRGRMVHKYADGKTKEVKVSGTFSGSNVSKATTRYDKMTIAELKK